MMITVCRAPTLSAGDLCELCCGDLGDIQTHTHRVRNPRGTRRVQTAIQIQVRLQTQAVRGQMEAVRRAHIWAFRSSHCLYFPRSPSQRGTQLQPARKHCHCCLQTFILLLQSHLSLIPSFLCVCVRLSRRVMRRVCVCAGSSGETVIQDSALLI